MKARWVLCLDRAEAASLAPLRLHPGVEVAEEPARCLLWVRGGPADEQTQQLLSGLPARRRYEWLPNDRLRPLTSRIPADPLPTVNWQRLESWLGIEIPLLAIPGDEPRPIPLRLVRSGVELEPGLLLTGLDTWATFALAAPEVRLVPLHFAVKNDEEALVRGTPLPPLPGRRFVLHGALAVPAGFTWEPAVGLAVLLRRFHLSADALVLWHEDNTFTRLHVEQFIAVTRSAVRATMEAVARR